MRWWCSASGRDWTWAWRPYLGAWLVIALAVWSLRRAGAWRREVAVRRRVALGCGLALLLVSTDWPLSALGAGYLLSIQMVRQVLIVLVASPLLLFGAPESLGRWLIATRRRRRSVRILSTPLLSLVVATALLIGVNLPIVVDSMISTQIGSFALDLIWITAGLLIWFPVQPPSPITPRLSGPLVTVYLIAVAVSPLPIAFFMTWSDYPIYSVFELAPRVISGFTPRSDQDLAAAIFQVIGGLIIWAQIAVRFVRMASAGSTKGFRGVHVSSASPANRSTTSSVDQL